MAFHASKKTTEDDVFNPNMKPRRNLFILTSPLDFISTMTDVVIPWVPGDIFFLTILVVRGEAASMQEPG